MWPLPETEVSLDLPLCGLLPDWLVSLPVNPQHLPAVEPGMSLGKDWRETGPQSLCAPQVDCDHSVKTNAQPVQDRGQETNVYRQKGKCCQGVWGLECREEPQGSRRGCKAMWASPSSKADPGLGIM